jgi:hypothetical protein
VLILKKNSGAKGLTAFTSAFTIISGVSSSMNKLAKALL